MATLVLTILGDDRPGLVSALSAPIAGHGASWDRSQMARLGGKFAGILLVDVADHDAGALIADLEALANEHLAVSVELSAPVPPALPAKLILELVGDDRPGIVSDISALLAQQGVSIEDLTTSVSEAPMAGGMLFRATAVLAAPAEVSSGQLRVGLEALADELMVDIGLVDG